MLPPNHLTNFEIQKYYQSEPRYNGAYWRNNLLKIKDEVYLIHPDECKWIRTHWVTLHVNDNNKRSSNDATYFDSFGVEHIPKEIKEFIGNRNVIKNIFRIQDCNAIMPGYFCIGFIGFMLKSKSLWQYTNSFGPNEYKKKYKVIPIFFQ